LALLDELLSDFKNPCLPAAAGAATQAGNARLFKKIINSKQETHYFY